MYDKCPKCGYQRQAGDDAAADACPSCGLVYRKYLQTLAGLPARTEARESAQDEDLRPGLLERLLYVPERIATWRIGANAALFAASFYLGWRYFLMDLPSWETAGTFLHTAMVPFHEFGHLLFRPFGEFMHNLGGSLAQVLMPLGFLLLFSLKNRDNFAASLMLWWAGTQFFSIAPYIYDAQTPTHILLTGRTGDSGGHDFIDVLGDLGLLHRGHQIAYVVHKLGLVVLFIAWGWGAVLLYRQFRNRSTDEQ